MKISRHYFVFLFLFLFSLYLLYYAQDSCKKWQENKDRLGLISGMTVKIFLVTILFFVFVLFFWCNWVCSDKTAKYISSLCFFFFSFFFLGVTGYVRIQDSWKFLVTILIFFFFLFFLGVTGSVWIGQLKNFSSLFCFFSFFFALYLLHYARESCKKWQEKEGKLGLISGMTVKIFLNIWKCAPLWYA